MSQEKSKIIVPAVLVKSEEEFIKKVQLVEPFVEYAQIDVMDKKFVPNWTFFDPQVFKIYKGSLRYEAHLMVELTEKWIRDCSIALMDRVIIHYESVSKEKLKFYLELLKSYNIKAGIALNPMTPFDVIFPYLSYLETVLVMSVNPGFSGQFFKPEALLKIKDLKKYRFIKIGVDGGVNESNIRSIKQAGADYFCVNSPIFSLASGEEVANLIHKLETLLN